MEQLKLLCDYTTMHIGLYTAIATVFAAAIATKNDTFQVNHNLMFAAIGFICLTGFAGGVVASSIPQYTDLETFLNSDTGPFFRSTLMPGLYWTYVEHTFFWLAVICAAAAVWRGSKRVSSSERRADRR